jgi:Kef-type K+ transport system membrane component KefB
MTSFFRPIIMTGIMSGIVFSLIAVASYAYGIANGTMCFIGIISGISSVVLFAPAMGICDELEWLVNKEG